MVAVGIDTHKDSLADCVVDELGNPVAEHTFANDQPAHKALLAWIRAKARNATVGIEGSARCGAAAARFLLGAGVRVREVPPQLETQIRDLVGKHPLLEMHGVGLITAAKLIAEAGDVRRFHSVDAFAMLAGVAPIPASSGQTQRMRLNRGGNRQLNRAFHTIAMVQAVRYPPAREFLARKAAESKSGREGTRALKRQLVRSVFRRLEAGAEGLSHAA